MDVTKNWNELTLNPKVILGYFERAPSLQEAEFHSVSLLRDGPSALIVFDVGEFPQMPSPKWPEGANACQITLSAISLSEVVLTKWGTGVGGDLEIVASHRGIEISFTGEGEFRFLCSHVEVTKVVGYVRAGK